MDTLTTTKLSSEEIFDLMKKFITEVIGEEFVEEMTLHQKVRLPKIWKWTVSKSSPFQKRLNPISVIRLILPAGCLQWIWIN